MTRSLRYLLRILFVPYQRVHVLSHNLVLYGVSFFYFVLALSLCQFRLVFADPLLLRIYESRYSELTGIFHYLPGKYEVFLVSSVFVPIWLIHFLYSANLNIFFEDKTLEERQVELDRQAPPADSSESGPSQMNARFSADEFRLSGYRKKVMLVSSWRTLTYSKKILRNIIIFVPVLVLVAVNLGAQYTTAILIDQKNFNLFNVTVNVFVMYLLVFHVSVFMPLMFVRCKVLLRGDYLWNPDCNFIVENTPDLDLETLHEAIQNYDVAYLEAVTKGEDPARSKAGFDVEEGRVYWKKSKLGDFSKVVDKNFETIREKKQDADEIAIRKGSRVSVLEVKYTTFDDKASETDDLQTEGDLSHTDSVGTDMTPRTNETQSTSRRKQRAEGRSESKTQQSERGDREKGKQENKTKLRAEQEQISSEEFERVSPGGSDKEQGRGLEMGPKEKNVKTSGVGGQPEQVDSFNGSGSESEDDDKKLFRLGARSTITEFKK